MTAFADFSVFNATAVSPRERAMLTSGDADGRVLIQSWINWVPMGSMTEDPIRGMRPAPSLDMRKYITLRYGAPAANTLPPAIPKVPCPGRTLSVPVSGKSSVASNWNRAFPPPHFR